MSKFIKQPIGYIVVEGCGPDIMESARSVLKAIEKISEIKFRLIKYKGEAPALKYTTKSYNQLKSFYKQIKKEGGCIIRTGIYARQVYKLRNYFKMTFKPIL
jgi:isocitrate/isopropylmalate dehydrogenase